MTHPIAIAKFVAVPLELGSFGLPVVFAWSITPESASTMMSAASILIAALFVGWVNVIAAKAAARSAVKPLAVKLDEITPLVTKIDAHVNSEKTRSEGEIATLKMQIDMQRETIADLKLSKELLAQAKALADAAKAVPAPTALSMMAAPVLQDIEQNTKDTAENTTRASAVVAEVKDAVDQLKEKA